jgi:hypothetical protein
LAVGDEKIIITMKSDGKETISESPVSEKKKIVIIINNQFTIAPNTTQIASGAGRNSAAGNNAALDSSNTEQQQSVGSQGKARNFGMKGNQSEPHAIDGEWNAEEELTIVINNQVNETSEESSATQVASGSNIDSAGGSNAAIQSSNTKQQHAVSGDNSALASNLGMNNPQEEISEADGEENEQEELEETEELEEPADLDGQKVFPEM